MSRAGRTSRSSRTASPPRSPPAGSAARFRARRHARAPVCGQLREVLVGGGGGARGIAGSESDRANRPLLASCVRGLAQAGRAPALARGVGGSIPVTAHLLKALLTRGPFTGAETPRACVGTEWERPGAVGAARSGAQHDPGGSVAAQGRSERLPPTTAGARAAVPRSQPPQRTGCSARSRARPHPGPGQACYERGVQLVRLRLKPCERPRSGTGSPRQAARAHARLRSEARQVVHAGTGSAGTWGVAAVAGHAAGVVPVRPGEAVRFTGERLGVRARANVTGLHATYVGGECADLLGGCFTAGYAARRVWQAAVISATAASALPRPARPGRRGHHGGTFTFSSLHGSLAAASPRRVPAPTGSCSAALPPPRQDWATASRAAVSVTPTCRCSASSSSMRVAARARACSSFASSVFGFMP